MKIEVGESLILSWLRHVQGCMVVQKSWKPSPTWAIRDRDGALARFAALAKHAIDHLGADVFKGQGLDQLVRQAEIDVLGLRLHDTCSAPAIFAVDVAFHENGLQYGDPNETISRVVKKLMRAELTLGTYLKFSEAELIFATPRAADRVVEQTTQYLAALEAFRATSSVLSGQRVRYRVIANQDFVEQIVRPVVAKSSEIADTSEIFLRAQQLLQLCELQRHPRAARPQSSPEGVRIGEHVRTTMAELARRGGLNPEIVRNLLDPEYCRSTFRLSYPFLCRFAYTSDESGGRQDKNGYSRYWKQPLRIGDAGFLMCSQWFEWQRPAFETWARAVGGLDPA